ncbi:MAG: hypothetical protein AB1489_10290 [Acidobacteriota bacterium]
MKIDFTKYVGILPYASEILGVYQPLLGWKSKLTIDRMNREQDTVFRSLTDRALARVPANVGVEVKENDDDYLEATVTGLSVPDVINTHVVPRVAAEIDSLNARLTLKKLSADKVPTDADWKTIFAKADLEKQLVFIQEYAWPKLESRAVPSSHPDDPDLNAYIDAFPKVVGDEDETSVVLKALLDREVAISAYLYWLSLNKPSVLEALFFRKVANPYVDLLSTVDPLETFGANNLQAVLSPIGVVHLFRQYFFELDTFLGPAVEHVWIAPQSTLELVEQRSLRTTTERIIEQLSDTTTKTETALTEQDELSTAVREENRSDMQLGFGASVGYHNGTVDAEAHADLSLSNSRVSARETAHKQMREQSSRLSAEIRNSFRSTLRTVVERTESTERRYVLQNNTKAIINYELRRKLRLVGVQVQDLGTQLCWQVFVDDPGRDLGVAKLLHIAEPPDLAGLRAPDPPPRLEDIVERVNIQFPYMNDPDAEGEGETDVLYIDGDDQEHIGGIHNIGYNDRIFYKKTYTLQPPKPGYTLSDQFSARTSHSGTVEVEIKKVADTTIELIMHQVNFKDQPFVELEVSTIWKPNEEQNKALQAAYTQSLAKYDAEISARTRQAFLDAARERIKLASQIRKRRFEDLRDEERTAVYRRLISQLLAVGEEQKQDEHVTSELIRAIFDVDKMLYFVAPDWWRTRTHDDVLRQTANSPERIPEQQLVGWDGFKASGRRDNYLITEESDPATLGSSLGWLLQLDGDRLRNVFLNSPWVKAVIPIRPGREVAALNWLSLADKAGKEGLDGLYAAPPAELNAIVKGLKDAGYTVGDKPTLRDAIIYLGLEIVKNYKEITTPKKSVTDPKKNIVPTETVFERGFDPLAGGFELNSDPAKVFSQWVEVLPTDQLVAIEYDVTKHL